METWASWPTFLQRLMAPDRPAWHRHSPPGRHKGTRVPPPSDIRNDGPHGPYYASSADTQPVKAAVAADLAVWAEPSSKLPLYKIRLAEDEKPDIKRRPYKAWVLLVL